MPTAADYAPASNGAIWTGRVLSGLVIAFLLAWIRTRPLAPFGWYRVALGLALLLLFRG